MARVLPDELKKILSYVIAGKTELKTQQIHRLVHPLAKLSVEQLPMADGNYQNIYLYV